MNIKPVRVTEWRRADALMETEYGCVVYEKWMELEIPRLRRGNKHKYEVWYKGNKAALHIIS